MTIRYTTVKLKPYGNYNCTVNFLGNRLKLYFNFNSRLNKRFVSVWLGNTCLLQPSILSGIKSYELNFNAKLNGIYCELRFMEVTDNVSEWVNNLLYFIETDDTVSLEKIVYDISTFETNDNNNLPDIISCEPTIINIDPDLTLDISQIYSLTYSVNNGADITVNQTPQDVGGNSATDPCLALRGALDAGDPLINGMKIQEYFGFNNPTIEGYESYEDYPQGNIPIEITLKRTHSDLLIGEDMVLLMFNRDLVTMRSCWWDGTTIN